MATVTLAPRTELIRYDAKNGRFRQRRYQVKVIAGPEAGKEVTIEGPLTVGTSAEAGLTLTDTSVSRLHLALEPRNDGVTVRDLGSKNGTFIAAVRIQEAMLAEGRDVELGRTVLRVAAVERDAGAPVDTASFGGLIAASPAMRRLFGVLARIAPGDSTVLLAGETGTGKSEVARAIHRESPRARAPFVVVDSGALPAQLVESELFGHVKGSFTGATSDRPGLVLQAHGGVLFIDEVAELPLELQTRLLRLLETRQVRRLGDPLERTLDVRIVAATHRSLPDEVKKGRFREDLYYRLAVVEVVVPPLRERREDVALLAEHFVKQRGQSFVLTPSLLARLQEYAWPGNVRELRNLVERALAGAEPGELLPVKASAPTAKTFKEAKERVLDAFTREYLGALFARHGGNISAVAREAGLNRNHVAELAERLGLR
ncbi:MAG: sigma 54-dependent Fis family transcriptional regulator [Myxococcaceae bacterium]|nr:sigma 54-dependent Fis family transcriptional regulator [Myxococcaceae bacterium]